MSVEFPCLFPPFLFFQFNLLLLYSQTREREREREKERKPTTEEKATENIQFQRGWFKRDSSLFYLSFVFLRLLLSLHTRRKDRQSLFLFLLSHLSPLHSPLFIFKGREGGGGGEMNRLSLVPSFALACSLVFLSLVCIPKSIVSKNDNANKYTPLCVCMYVCQVWSLIRD